MTQVITVQELIDALLDVDNKDLPVYVFFGDGDIKTLDFVDELTDRVDINVLEEVPSIDVSKCEPKEGDEDSFSNLGG